MREVVQVLLLVAESVFIHARCVELFNLILIFFTHGKQEKIFWLNFKIFGHATQHVEC